MLFAVAHRRHLSQAVGSRQGRGLPRRATRSLRLEPLEERALLHADPVSSIAQDVVHDDVLHAPTAAVIGPGVAPTAITSQALLPDLTPWASQSRGFMYDWTATATELRLTTAAANLGIGRLELRGGATHGDTQDVYQRVYEPNGSYTDVLAGTFSYHPGHGHIHFDGFSEYRLRAVLPDGGVGAIVAAGDKISFCLLDVERYNTSGPNSPYFLTCGQVQGISVGWADVYDRGLPGQSIDITGVPNGSYWLEVMVDPENHLIESNEANNVTRIQISLQRSTGGGPIPLDAFEPNDTFATASILAPPEDHTYTDLSIHAANNSDYYRVTASASGTMGVRLAFQHSQGDVDLEVFNASQSRLGRSESVSNNEQVSVNAVAGQYYFVRVYGYNGATNPNYSMTIDQAEGSPGGVGDLFEQNDSFAAARSLTASDQTYTSLTIDAANDDDYYSLVPTATGTLAVSLAFENSQGNLNLQVFNASQTQLGQSTTTGNSEQVDVQVSAGQTYYIRVFGFNGATSPNYSMTVDVPAPSGGTGDPFEENDSFAAARGLAATDQSYTGLSIDAANDDDYYSVVPAASGAMTVSLAFQHSQGDVDLDVYNASQSRLGRSESTGNSEQLSVQVTAGQTYYIRAFGYNGATNPNYSMTIDVPATGGGSPTGVFYLSATGGGTLTSTTGAASVTFTDADVLQLTVQSNGQYEYQLYFDGSDVGLTTGNEDIDAFAFLADGSIVISTTGSFSVPAPGGGTISGVGQDLLRFVPTSLGTTTAGQWSLYFDGSDVGLTTSDENIDAAAVLSDGRLLISTTGAFSVSGASGQDEDLAAFLPSSLGATTAGSWSLYFDGSDVGLATNNNEDVNAVDVRESGGNPTLYFSTIGAFSVTGASGADEDVFAFNPTSLGSSTAGTFGPGLAFDGSLYGLASFNVDGIHLGSAPSPLAALAQTATAGSAPSMASGLTATATSSQNTQAVPNGAVALPATSAGPLVATGSGASTSPLQQSRLTGSTLVSAIEDPDWSMTGERTTDRALIADLVQAILPARRGGN